MAWRDLLSDARSGARARAGREERARVVALGLAATRAALGLAALLAPDLAARPWVGRAGEGPGRRVLARALGGRDLALGLGALVAGAGGAPLRGWIEAGALADSGDVLATALSFQSLPRVGRLLVLGSATGAALAGAAVAPRL